MSNKDQNIILVEDDQELLELLAFILKDEGYNVRSYENPQFKYVRKKTKCILIKTMSFCQNHLKLILF